MEFFEIMLYVLGSILLVVLIVLGIKLIISVERINAILESVEKKVKTVDKVFNVVDKVADSCAIVSERVVDVLDSGLAKLFVRKSKKIKELEEEDL